MVPATTSRSRRYYPRRCKLVYSTSALIDSLPDEVLSDILARVPADDLHDRARLVCRRWYYIISSSAFVNAHLHHSSYGLVLCKTDSAHPIYVSATEQSQIEVSLLSYNCMAKGSCNGLVAGFLTPQNEASRVLNPATMREFFLPGVGYRYQLCGIAYGATSMEYKVVRLHFDRSRFIHEPPNLAILTVGVDNSWRKLQVEYLPENLRPLLYANAAVTEGFIHWGARNSGELLTLNVKTEIITETIAPPHARACSRNFYYLSTGRDLSLLFMGRDLMWEVWELKQDTGEWRECRHFQFASNQIDVGHTFFGIFGWVRYPDILACSSIADTVIFYNLQTHEIDSTELPGPATRYKGFMHKNTLLWLSNGRADV